MVDADGNALHHFGEIAGRVVRRQQGDLGAGRGRNALDPAAQLLTRETVDGDLDRLARRDMRELGLLVVRDHIDLRQRHHNVDEVGADIDVVAGLYLTLADHSIERRRDPCVTELELGTCQRRLRRLDIGGALLPGALQNFELMLLGRDHRAARAHVGLRLGVGGDCLLEPLPRAGLGLRQRLLPLLLLPRLDLHGFGRQPRRAWLSTAGIGSQIFIAPAVAWLATVFGLRRVLGIPSLVYAGVSLAIPFVHDYPTLLTLSVVHGLLLGTFVPAALMIVFRNLPIRWWLPALSIYAIRVGFALDTSTSLVGFYVDHLGWQWLYWQGVVIAPLMGLMVYLGTPNEPVYRALLRNADWGGMLLLGASVSMIYAGLDQGNRLDWLGSGTVMAQHEHRQGAVAQQEQAALLWPELADRGKEVRHQRGVGQAGQRIEQDHNQPQADIAREQHVQARRRRCFGRARRELRGRRA